MSWWSSLFRNRTVSETSLLQSNEGGGSSTQCNPVSSSSKSSYGSKMSGGDAPVFAGTSASGTYAAGGDGGGLFGEVGAGGGRLDRVAVNVLGPVTLLALRDEREELRSDLV